MPLDMQGKEAQQRAQDLVLFGREPVRMPCGDGRDIVIVAGPQGSGDILGKAGLAQVGHDAVLRNGRVIARIENEFLAGPEDDSQGAAQERRLRQGLLADLDLVTEPVGFTPVPGKAQQLGMQGPDMQACPVQGNIGGNQVPAESLEQGMKGRDSSGLIEEPALDVAPVPRRGHKMAATGRPGQQPDHRRIDALRTL
ncbi:hypothetical protein GWI72_09815 [Microvirga tunisiensis]|uniref:Uncharacterized protein n=1 Tax=Pannonibacter tanglangensis TaxID=2750084 RepID=A0A7X5F2H1_9HYPH|nr:hypothetical protein [Pannonibacter sp. XCT-53]NBN78563.1 hypothetical protein [Pannonibacter sp. XCT-53]